MKNLTISQVVQRLPEAETATRDWLFEAANRQSRGLDTPLYFLLGPGDLNSLPQGVSKPAMALAIAEAYLISESMD